MKYYMYKAHILSWIILVSLLSGCVTISSNPTPRPSETLEKAKKVATYHKIDFEFFESFKSLLDIVGYKLPSLKYDVGRYYVTYKTIYKGKEIIASGTIYLPERLNSGKPFPIISSQHGTITANRNAPFNLPLSLSDLDISSILPILVASIGYVFVLPDYIGFGSTSNTPHPYYIEKPLSRCVVDMIKASLDLTYIKNVHVDGRTFLIGYSQGGYVTMATHKYIEQKKPKGINLIASFPAAGGYDIEGVQRYFLNSEHYSTPVFMAYVSEAYRSYYSDIKLSPKDLFQPPYASRILHFFDGTSTVSKLNNQLTSSVGDLLIPDVIANFNSNAKYSTFKKALRENSLINDGWKPQRKMYMYHGDKDAIIPLDNSKKTANLLNVFSNGKLVVITDGTHETTYVPYLKHALEKISKLN